MKLSDFKGLFKKSVATVMSVRNPYGDYYVIKLKPEPGTTWLPGEHGVFTLPNKKVTGKKFRAFSVASPPSEGYMLIGTRTGGSPSSYKQNLIEMEAGEKVSIRGPFGWFVEQDSTSPIVMMATGVGITPIRGLLVALKDEKNRPIHIVFGSSDYHLFGEDIEVLTQSNNNIHLYKTSEQEQTKEQMIVLSKEYGNKALYYISGHIKVIKSTKKLLKGQSIQGKRIIHDPFYGY